MSPSKLDINGPRPSPLKIKKDSHFINKSSTSSSISTAVFARNPHQQQRHPVIIYTHSPKVIHTQARDFMALVQKLTGISRSNIDHETAPPPPPQHDNNESPSGLTDENGGGNGHQSVSTSLDLNQMHPCFADIPLFTPNSTDFFSSSRPLYRYSDSMYASPSMGNSFSPSVLEFMKGLPEY